MSAPAPAAGPLVEVCGLARAFGAARVLDGLDLRIGAGEFVALLGRSGSGKSTLLRALAGLDPVAAGAVRVPPERAVVFQEPRLLPWKRVLANVVLGLRGDDAPGRAAAALAEVGLAHRSHAWPSTLSGGEAQRAALARALVREPRLLLLDEPFASLDALTRLRMQALVRVLWEKRRPSVLLVTHDVDEALGLADRVLVLAGGRIGFDAPVTPPRPRRQAEPALAELRAGLLHALGIDEAGEEIGPPSGGGVRPSRDGP